MSADKQFSYCVGRPWHPEDVDSSICVYAYGSQVHHGSMANAEDLREFVDEQDPIHKHFIYKLEKVA